MYQLIADEKSGNKRTTNIESVGWHHSSDENRQKTENTALVEQVAFLD